MFFQRKFTQNAGPSLVSSSMPEFINLCKQDIYEEYRATKIVVFRFPENLMIWYESDNFYNLSSFSQKRVIVVDGGTVGYVLVFFSLDLLWWMAREPVFHGALWGALGSLPRSFSSAHLFLVCFCLGECERSLWNVDFRRVEGKAESIKHFSCPCVSLMGLVRVPVTPEPPVPAAVLPKASRQRFFYIPVQEILEKCCA